MNGISPTLPFVFDMKSGSPVATASARPRRAVNGRNKSKQQRLLETVTVDQTNVTPSPSVNYLTPTEPVSANAPPQRDRHPLHGPIADLLAQIDRVSPSLSYAGGFDA